MTLCDCIYFITHWATKVFVCVCVCMCVQCTYIVYTFVCMYMLYLCFYSNITPYSEIDGRSNKEISVHPNPISLPLPLSFPRSIPRPSLSLDNHHPNLLLLLPHLTITVWYTTCFNYHQTSETRQCQ